MWLVLYGDHEPCIHLLSDAHIQKPYISLNAVGVIVVPFSFSEVENCVIYQDVNLSLAQLRVKALVKSCRLGDVGFVIILDFPDLLIKISCFRMWDERFHSTASRRKYTFLSQ